ncbi:hypothetical protein GCM10011348_15400 [Marinobacterium nitratireducens]|uniref:YCII-related domain-containing protein n=1 Tax=Marinobacterium nitratireducens TaxID=518897 RepID=A0A917ZB00_9GAMM|nr:YciI family protein [Marinobacterium nitratireducens]GGO79908.1 hypothetical protein GCM10011348_15400 [Marinobacterium nitratireducens]
MYFAVFARDKPGMGAIRAQVRPEHRKYLREHIYDLNVVLGGPTLDATAESMNGTLLVIEAETLLEVQRFVADDPYHKAGLFGCLEICPWDWSLGRIEVQQDEKVV